jgi:hypothetical protein
MTASARAVAGLSTKRTFLACPHHLGVRENAAAIVFEA